jgi:hypothetical protein
VSRDRTAAAANSTVNSTLLSTPPSLCLFLFLVPLTIPVARRPPPPIAPRTAQTCPRNRQSRLALLFFTLGLARHPWLTSLFSKLDLLVRVRYMNPLPPPPFPPKLFQIPSDINRLGEPSYLSHLATSAPLPMLVDSEMGMPLDLNEFEGVWDGNDQGELPERAPRCKL